jgi:hypothetical protein
MTKIQLIGDVWDEGINAYLELSEEVDVPLNFAVSDIRDLSKRTGTFSKSIRVAGTKANSQVLNHLYDVNIVSGTATFDINKRQSCVLIQDGQVILDNAVMQLTDVVITSQGGGRYERVDYLITVKDTMSDFFTSLGNARLQDLDFSDLNHVYNSTNVVASFDHDFTDGYKYLLPISNDTTYNLIEMKPAIYGRQYWDRLFSRAGFRYVWDDKEDVFFSKWLHPYNGSKAEIAEATIDDATVIVENTSVEDYTGNAFNIDLLGTGDFFSPDAFDIYETPTELQDNNNYFNPATFEYTVPFELPTPNTLTYRVTYNIDLVLVNNSGVTVRVDEDFFVKSRLQVRKNTATTAANVSLIPTSSYGSGIIYQSNGSHSIGAPIGTTFASVDNPLLNLTGSVDLVSTNLQIGDILTFGGRLERWYTLGVITYGVLVNDATSAVIPPAQYVLTTRVNDIKIEIVPSVESFGFNFPVLMNLYTMKNVKQSDYVKAIMTMFNLYALINPNDPRELILKQRDQYYDEGDVKDWNAKLAKDREQKITFLPELTAKRLKLTYKEDKDAMNVGYLQNVGEIYGEVEYIFDNEYIKNDERKEVMFSPSPFYRTPFGAVVLGINGAEPNTNPRIVIDGGKLPCGFYEIIDYGTTGASLNDYPYAGHWDKPVNPSFDLNFGKCAYYFDNNYGSPTDNNLANLFWRRTMAQINSGKMLTGMFNLTVNDIAALKLNDKIYLLGQYWFINKVIDYNANKRQLTKVELLSADEFVTLPPFKVRRPVKPSPLDGLIGVPVAEMITHRNRSLSSIPTGVMVLGKNNFVQANVRNALVVGDGQTVDQDGIYTPRLVVGGVPVVADTEYQTIGIINQTSTNPIVPSSYLFDSITFVNSTRSNVGEYELTAADTYTEGVVFITNGISDGFVTAYFNGTDKILINSYDATGTLSDGIIKDASIMIKLYK